MVDELFPSICVTALDSDAGRRWLAEGPGRYCPRCGILCGPYAASARGCAACLKKPVPWQRLVRLGSYQAPLDGWIRDMKFRGHWTWAAWFGSRLAQAVPADGSAAGPAIVCPVPLHWWRRCGRGYNQAHLIAQALASARGWPVVQALRRVRHRPAQSTLPMAQRVANLRGVFRLSQTEVRGRTVWLVDDVKTTGATLSACTHLLKRAGAAQINVAVVAVAEPGR